MSKRARSKSKSKRFVQLFSEDGFLFDAPPGKPGARQLTREQVQALVSDAGIICSVVKAESASVEDDWYHIINS